MKRIREISSKIGVAAVIVFFLITASTSSYGIGSFENSEPTVSQKLQSAVATVQKPVSKAFREAEDFLDGLVHFRKTARENKQLKKENEALKQELEGTRLSREEKEELQQLETAVNYVGSSESYQRISADVVSLEESGVYGILTISAGSCDGIQTGNAVLGPSGMIGRVSSVSEKTAKVSALINTSTSVSFCVSGTETTIGIVTGDGSSGLTGYLLDNGRDIHEGDVLITSGLGKYPSGLEIGTVSRVSKDKSTGQISIQAKPSADFYSAGIVTVMAEK